MRSGSPGSPAGDESCSTVLGSSTREYGRRGTHCRIPACPCFHREYCSQVSRQSRTLNFKAKEVGKVSFLESLLNECTGTQFHHLHLASLNDQRKKRDRYTRCHSSSLHFDLSLPHKHVHFTFWKEKKLQLQCISESS